MEFLNMTRKIDPVLSTLGIGAISILATFYIYNRIFTKKWKLVGYLSEINFYPIKSCAVVNIDEAQCDILGLSKGRFNDRTFMITDTEGNYKSGRAIATLVNIKPNIDKSTLTLRADNMEDLKLDLEIFESSRDVTLCNIWNDKINVIDCGREAAEWISKVILSKNTGLKLVYYPHSKSHRSIRKKFTVSSSMTMKDLGAFSDGSSYMLASNSSLADLNARLQDTEITANQFRANLVVKGSIPHDEDNWKLVKIGNYAIFEAVLPCTRCQFVNVDPKTGIRDDEEPLKTLKKYRQVNNNNALRKIVGDSPKMGIQMGLRYQGKIKIGDPIYVTY